MEIKFLGATRFVTGSCYHVKTSETQFLVDCGMFQGVNEEEKNQEGFDFDPRKIDFVVLTHSHLDHCGLLPKLYKEGFRGNIYSSIPTRYIVEHMLLDSAKVQEIKLREAKQQSDEWVLADSAKKNLNPMYDTTHVLGTLELFVPIEFKEEVQAAADVTIKLLRVGHALGASAVKCKVRESENTEKSIVFSGDMGNHNQKLDTRIDYPKKAEYVVMESLYGNKFHESRTKTEGRFVEVVNKTLSRGGNVLIPSFTYQRSQELLILLKRLISEGKISDKVKIFLDSPLAIKVTNVYKRYYKYLSPELIKGFKSGEDLFHSPNIELLKDRNSSKGIRKRRGKIVIAGHGMCAGGRILFHLLHNLSDRRSSVIFVGFQAKGTTGREIVEGAREVLINDKKVKVRAQIEALYGFSAHGDHNDLMKWLGSIDREGIKKVFLTHAEEETSLGFKETLESKGYSVEVPKWKESYTI